MSAVLILTCAPLATALPPPGGTVDEACDQNTSDPVWGILWTNQRHGMTETCGNVHGQLGYGPVKPCQPSTMPGVTLRSILNLVHQHAHDKPGCSPTLRDILP